MPQDQAVMMLKTTVVPVARPRRETAISRTLRAVSADLVLEKPAVVETLDAAGLGVRMARDHATRERIYRLAYEVYRRKEYVPECSQRRYTAAYDARPETAAFLAEDASGQECGTVSLVFDGQERLPSDEIFGVELCALRDSGRRLAEVARLALASENAASKQVLLALFNYIYVYARRVRNCTDFVIEVNPRHVRYYQHLLRFEVLGDARPCPRVQGAPAVLLRLDLDLPAREARRFRTGSEDSRSMYVHYLPEARYQAIAAELERATRASQ